MSDVEAARQKVIDWVAAWPEDARLLLDDLIAFEEAVRAEERAARASLGLQVRAHHEASVLAKTVGTTTAKAWGMHCPVCARALAGASTPTEGDQGDDH